MLETLNPQPQDKILQLIAMYRDDPRTTKIDLGVGVYKDATGLTPVMRAVKAAEKKLWETEKTKTYTGLAGEPAYNAALVQMILGDGFADRAASVATPGGTGAIRQALELIKMANPKARVWMSAPTWPNHPSIVKYLGMTGVEYRYFDVATSGIDFAGLMADLEGVAAGDAVLLGGNPTAGNDEPVAVARAGNQFTLTFYRPKGVTEQARIESGSLLVGGSWQTVPNWQSSSIITDLSDYERIVFTTTVPGGAGGLFYRVVFE